MRKRMMDGEALAEVNKRLEEARKQWKVDHTPVIKMNYGNTYISVNKYDYEPMYVMNKILTLLQLMNVEYSTSAIVVNFDDNKENNYYVIINGEDAERATFIQRFIDNGYVLNWNLQ